MADKIQVDEDCGIIEVESHGNISKADIAQSIANVQNILTEKGINKILVDTSKQKQMPSISEILDLFSNFPRDFKLALFVVKSQDTEKYVSFAKTVGASQGNRVKIFYDKGQARQWLNS